MKDRNLLQALLFVCAMLIYPPSLRAADSVINAQWDQGGPSEQPEEGVDYIIKVTPPASPEFPDVELITGRLDWRVWSTDPDDPDGVGNIGVISCPHPENFAVAIRNDAHPFLHGARDVKRVTLVPSSSDNFSNITDARILGQLTEDVTVQADATGAGGEVGLLSIAGAVTADMTIHKLGQLGVSNDVFGTILVDELTGGLDIGNLFGNVDIGSVTGTTSGGDSILRVFIFSSGSITVSEASANLILFFPSGVDEPAQISFGDILGGALMDFGTGPGSEADVAGTIEFLSGIPGDATVNIWNDVAPTGRVEIFGDLTGSVWLAADVTGSVNVWGVHDGTIDLDGNVDGSVYIAGGGTGTVNAANVSAGGDVLLSDGGLPYGGTAAFGSVGSGGSVLIRAADLAGTISAGTVSGSVQLVQGPFSTTGAVLPGARIQVADSLTGTVDIDGDMSGTVSVQGGHDGLIDVGGNVSGGIDLSVLTGELRLHNDLSGSISVTNRMEFVTTQPVLEVLGYVTWTGVVDVADMVGPATLTFNNGGAPGEREYAGQLILGNGLKQDQTATISGLLNLPGFVDLNGGGVAGTLTTNGGSGDIINGGAISGTVSLGSGANGLSGDATFSAVESSGQILTDDCAGLGGEIRVTGPMAGAIYVGGDTVSGGDILVDGDISGDVEVADATGCGATNAKGLIHSNADGVGGGDITGSVTVTAPFNGDVCADNLPPGDALPANIDLTFGSLGTVCGAAPCFVADVPTVPSGEPGFAKNRYVSVLPGNVGESTALRVALSQFHDPALLPIGSQWWVGAPIQVCEKAGQGSPSYSPPNCGLAPGQPQKWFWAASLVCDPADAHYMDWSTLAQRCVFGSSDGLPCTTDGDCPNGTCGADGTVHIYHRSVIPSPQPLRPDPDTIYEVQAIHEACDTSQESNFSAPLAVTMSGWGDVVGMGYADPPDGDVDLVDVQALLHKFSDSPDAPMKSQCDIVGMLDKMVIDKVVNLADNNSVLRAFSNPAYDTEFGEPCACPSCP